ncbi:unnamed protein product [Vicia faba]|uniref:Uncharacterized protein n=1 Tax=Vicia faba TaxID=3906 RepID=A0AAV0Z615_VICFA|nr:unnamed protein product [Vicia faba]
MDTGGRWEIKQISNLTNTLDDGEGAKEVLSKILGNTFMDDGLSIRLEFQKNQITRSKGKIAFFVLACFSIRILLFLKPYKLIRFVKYLKIEPLQFGCPFLVFMSLNFLK